MKLLCVTHGPAFGPATNGHWLIEFGQTYEAVRELVCPMWGLYYILAHDPDYGYAAEHFAELPDDEEMEEAVFTQQDVVLKALAEACPVEEVPADSFARIWGNLEKHMEGAL